MRHSLLFISLLILGCMSGFAQTDKFIGDWYRTSYTWSEEDDNSVSSKEIYRIKGNPTDGYTLRRKVIRVDNGLTISYTDFECESFNENELIFKVWGRESYYSFTPHGEYATLVWIKSYDYEKKKWYNMNIEYQLFRLDDF